MGMEIIVNIFLGFTLLFVGALTALPFYLDIRNHFLRKKAYANYVEAVMRANDASAVSSKQYIKSYKEWRVSRPWM